MGKSRTNRNLGDLVGEVPQLATLADFAVPTAAKTGRRHPESKSASNSSAPHRINLKAVSEALIEEGFDPAVEMTRILRGEIERDDAGNPVVHPVTGEVQRKYLVDPEIRLRMLNEVLQYTQPKLKAVEMKVSGTLDLTSEQLDSRLNMLLAKASKK